MPRQGQHPTLVFLRNLNWDIPKSGELFQRRHDADENPCRGNKNPNHALSTISVDNSVHTIMNGNPIRQRTITTRHPDRNPDQQCAAQQVDNPYKRRALHTTAMRWHTLYSRGFPLPLAKCPTGWLRCRVMLSESPSPFLSFSLSMEARQTVARLCAAQ